MDQEINLSLSTRDINDESKKDLINNKSILTDTFNNIVNSSQNKAKVPNMGSQNSDFLSQSAVDSGVYSDKNKEDCAKNTINCIMNENFTPNRKNILEAINQKNLTEDITIAIPIFMGPPENGHYILLAAQLRNGKNGIEAELLSSDTQPSIEKNGNIKPDSYTDLLVKNHEAVKKYLKEELKISENNIKEHKYFERTQTLKGNDCGILTAYQISELANGDRSQGIIALHQNDIQGKMEEIAKPENPELDTNRSKIRAKLQKDVGIYDKQTKKLQKNQTKQLDKPLSPLSMKTTNSISPTSDSMNTANSISTNSDSTKNVKEQAKGVAEQIQSKVSKPSNNAKRPIAPTKPREVQKGKGGCGGCSIM